jgi:XTP/dITP diphosphohydrolase
MIVLATNNQGKLVEFKNLLAGKGLEIVAQSELSISEIEESGLTFVENAILKARYASKQSNLPAIADDSGLMVDALNGAPGIYSARYAEGNGKRKVTGSVANIEKLLQELASVPAEKRTARFYCIIVYLKHANDPAPLICQGVWEGSILFEPRGSNGFGYDPIFWVPTHNCSAAELPIEIKNSISHRGKAIGQFCKLILSNFPGEVVTGDRNT